MIIKQYEIWTADLNPRFGTEAGKVRPVVVIQTDLLNPFHPSSLICPLTTNVNREANILRVHLKKGVAKLEKDCDIMVDQMRSIDNRRFKLWLGKLNAELCQQLKENIRIILDL